MDSFLQQIVNDLLAIKQFINGKLQNCNAILLLPIKRCDNQKASATINLVKEQLSQMNIDITENKNISDKHVGKHGLHLTNHRRVWLEMNFISYVKKL